MKLLYLPASLLLILYGTSNIGPPSETTFRYPIAIILLAIGIAIGSAIASIMAFKRHQTLRRILTLAYIAVMAGLFFAPYLIVSKIVVATDHREETSGFWPVGSTRYLAYRDIEFIRQASDVVDGSPRRIWHVRDIHGQWRQIELGDLWELHESAIKARLQQYGVMFRE